MNTQDYHCRKNTRLITYDYATPGYYYVTICTHNHQPYFGTIVDNEMELNTYGIIARERWMELPHHHKAIDVDEFVIMPNHIHGIVIVGAGPARPTNLSVIIGSYKSSVTRHINQMKNVHFKWQRSFYDHVIRNDTSLTTIREYIINNPAQWADDEYNSINNSSAVQAGLAPTKWKKR